MKLTLPGGEAHRRHDAVEYGASLLYRAVLRAIHRVNGTLELPPFLSSQLCRAGHNQIVSAHVAEQQCFSVCLGHARRGLAL
jgi:hypothetical protein